MPTIPYFLPSLRLGTVLVLSLAILLSACQGKSKPASENLATQTKADSAHPANVDQITLSKAQVQAAGIRLGGFTYENMASEVLANGIVAVPPQNQVSISAVLGGYVESVKVLPGQHVHKGAVVAILRAPEYLKLQQDYLQSSARVLFLAQDVERQRILDIEDVGAKRKLQQAQADYQSELAASKSLAAQLAQLNIDADRLRKTGRIQPTVNLITPLHGYVKSVSINPGQFVNPQDVLVEVVDRSDLHLELNVFEKDIARIQTGQQILFSVPNRQMPGELMLAHVFLIGKAFNADARTVPVHAHIVIESSNQLLPGQYVSARIQTAGNRLPTLPEEAVIQAGELSYIYAQVYATDSTATFHRIKVKPGASGHKDMALTLLEPIADTNRIVRQGAYFLDAERGKGQGGEE